MTTPLVARVKASILVDEKTGCWNWIGATYPTGYGYVWNEQTKKPMRAHRAAYALLVGPIPDSLCVLHRCDNTRCCNPEHLFLGSQLDNITDRCQKRRSATGETHARAKLTGRQVEEIRNRFAAGETNMERLCKDYGVNAANLGKIVRGRYWRTYPGPITPQHG